MVELFKKDSKGKIRVLYLSCEGNLLLMTSGLLGGKLTTRKRVCKPKNIGKSNETTAEEQAQLELESKYKEKLKEGYFKTKEEAENNLVILPMLAKDYNEHSRKIDWDNCCVQPKLDGMRALYHNGKFISRKGVEIDTIKHIQLDLDESIVLDGELYAHYYTFQENMSMIKKPTIKTLNIYFWVYDVITLGKDLNYKDRLSVIESLVEKHPHIKFTPTYKVTSKEEVSKYHNSFVEAGYEGAMVRWGDSPYKINGRSDSLLKYKDFIDEVYTIVDVVPSDKIPEQGVVVCRGFYPSEDGDSLGESYTFSCIMKVSHEERKGMLKDKEDYIGKTAEVRFFEYTDSGKPRFPTFLGIRLDK